MSDSLEYNCIIDCTPELRRSAEPNLLSLCAELLAARLINEDKEKSLRNRSVDEADRAAELISQVTNKVKENSANYHVFVAILEKDEPRYNSVLTRMKERYKSRERVNSINASAPKQAHIQSSDDHDNGFNQKCKHVVSKPMVDNCCQTLHNPSGANNQLQHQVYAAFGGICGCGICGSDLGCPNPLPAETTFPLLEHMNGLNKVQKDDLRARLKEETKQIMMQFYNLLSKFFNALKERKVSVDDIKTHLMVLDAFDDDDDRPAFHEQRDKLDHATTINEVFQVIKVFCSFFNYDLVEHLIDIIGMDEDKARLEEYNIKFTEYARRRIYECPPKTAMSTTGQCDMYMKLESRFSSKLSLNDLREFRFNVSKILKVSPYIVRLCCIEKGCIRLTFQIPHFVKQRSFPLTLEQGNSLLQLGMTRLTCGDYEFPIKDKHEIPPTSKKGHYPSTHVGASAQSCLDCNSRTGNITLLCNKHHICSECSTNRKPIGTLVYSKDALTCDICNSATTLHTDSSYTKSYRDAVLHEQQTTTCVQLTNPCEDEQQQSSIATVPTSTRGIWIFVNDSNIWIEAKKLQSKQKMFKTSEDHRVRMDMGKLADVLAKQRPIIEGNLYGSEPPSIDTVWKRIHEQGWKVHTTQRTSRGKEKQTTTTLVVDIVALAETIPPEQRSSIILVTGDASVVPAIERVVEIEGWSVEVYMWSHATSKQLHKLHSKHGNRVTVSSLDQYLNDITFTNMKFNYTNKNFLEMVKNSSLVFTVNAESKSFPGYVPTDQWMRKLEEIAERPCQYYWYHHPKIGQTSKLVIVFKRDSKGTTGTTFDISTLLKKMTASDKIQIPSVVRVQMFADFESSDQLDQFGGDFEQLGSFNPNDVQNAFQSDSVYVTSTSSNGPGSQLSKWNPHAVVIA